MIVYLKRLTHWTVLTTILSVYVGTIFYSHQNHEFDYRSPILVAGDLSERNVYSSKSVFSVNFRPFPSSAVPSMNFQDTAPEIFSRETEPVTGSIEHQNEGAGTSTKDTIAHEANLAPAVSSVQAVDRKIRNSSMERLEDGFSIFFEFDDSIIHPGSDAGKHLRETANFLLEHDTIIVVLVGHTDERGTREYNMALSTRRVKAINELLSAYGVPPRQIRVQTYGEERPVKYGSGEESWRENRRVELDFLYQ